MTGILERTRRRRLMAVRVPAFEIRTAPAATAYVAVNTGFFAGQGIEPPLVFCDAAR